MKMSMEHLWNDAVRGKPEVLGAKRVLVPHSRAQIPHGIQPGPPQ